MTSLTSLWQQRFTRAQRIALLLRPIPFIRLVGLNGSMVTHKMTKESDIDFYIVAQANRLFTVRLLVTLLVHLTGWRRYGSKIKGRICLNRFADEKLLEITPTNNYHARVFSGLVPLWAYRSTYLQYQQANEWMEQLGFKLAQPSLTQIPSQISKTWRLSGEWWLQGRVGDLLEFIFYCWQTKRILADPRTAADNSLVRISRHELCFHFKLEK